MSSRWPASRTLQADLGEVVGDELCGLRLAVYAGGELEVALHLLQGLLGLADVVDVRLMLVGHRAHRHELAGVMQYAGA